MARPEEKTILIVDDEEDVRDYLSNVLEDAGFRVITAFDGEDALAKIRRQAPDFISLDLVMPRKSGIKLLHELRKNKEWAQIPIVIVTAHAHDDLGKPDLDHIMDGKILSGPEVYLEKPVKPERYVQVVCERLNIEYSGSPSDDHVDAVRRELKDLIANADPEKLKDALRLLKEKHS